MKTCRLVAPAVISALHLAEDGTRAIEAEPFGRCLCVWFCVGGDTLRISEEFHLISISPISRVVASAVGTGLPRREPLVFQEVIRGVFQYERIA